MFLLGVSVNTGKVSGWFTLLVIFSQQNRLTMVHQLSNSRRHGYWIRDKRVYASCGESTNAGHRVATRYSHLQVIVTIKRAALMRQVTRRLCRQLHAVWESATRALGSLHQLNAAKVLR